VKTCQPKQSHGNEKDKAGDKQAYLLTWAGVFLLNGGSLAKALDNIRKEKLFILH